MEKQNFNKGEIIFKQGQFATTMYDICAGTVGIYAAYGTAEEKKLAELGEGEIFGEMGLIECYPRSATAVALKDGTLVQEINAQEFSEFCVLTEHAIFAVNRNEILRLDQGEHHLQLLLTGVTGDV